MKAIFAAQGSTLRVFHDIDAAMRDRGEITSSAYFISDSSYYLRNKGSLPLLEHKPTRKVFEWELTAVRDNLNQTRLAALESTYGDPTFSNALLCDRRISQGPLCKVTQDYAPRLTHSEMQSVLLTSMEALLALIDDVDPDFIVSFSPVTYGEYLLYLIARKHGIPYFAMRPTKIRNFITFAHSIAAGIPPILEAFERNLSAKTFAHESEAREYVHGARNRPVQYEGAVSLPTFVPQRAVRALIGALRQQLSPGARLLRQDNHVPPIVGSAVQREWLAPARSARARRIVARRLITEEEAEAERFVFFPLHSEPEIALSIYGCDYQNQIEAVRRLAQSIPATWKLVVKEHPRSAGVRRPNYYRKLLSIPNLYFARIETQPYFWITKAQAVVTISGFVGFEAAAAGTPVVILGDTLYECLPMTMVRRVANASELGACLEALLREYRYDEEALVCFVAACMSESVPVNLYSELLAKSGRVSFTGAPIQEQIDSLARLIALRLRHRFEIEPEA